MILLHRSHRFAHALRMARVVRSWSRSLCQEKKIVIGLRVGTVQSTFDRTSGLGGVRCIPR